MPINISFPSPKPLPGKNKDFPSVSARINSSGYRKAVSKLPAFSVSGAPEKPSNGSKPANARATVRTTIKQEPQEPAKKDAAKPPQPEKTKPVPFRARPVPASTYKPPFQPTVRKINKAVIEKEQAPVEIVNKPTIANEKEQAPVAIVNEPTIANEKEQAPVEIVNEPKITIDVEIAEPTHEAASCEPPKVNEPNGTNEDVCSLIESVNEPAEASSATEVARALLPDHPQGPGIPPFLPMVFIKDCIRPYVPQQWSHYTNPPDYGNLYDANGAYFWDRSMASYHCVRMSQECFYQHFPEHRVGDGALPRYDTQGYGDQSANVRVREIAEPTHEAASCEPPKVNEPNGTNEDVCSPIESVNEPAEACSATEGARALLPDHPQGPGIPPFLPMVFIKDCIRPYVPQQWSHYTNPPDYGNLYDANGAYFWDRSMASYHCVRMSQECFYQHFPEHRVGDGALPRYDTQGYGDQSANVRVRNVRTRKPHKAEWNASYQRRLARRPNERAERAAREQQSASTEISENTDLIKVKEKAAGNLDASIVVDQISASIEEVGLPEPTCDLAVEEHLPVYIQHEYVVSPVQGERSVDGTAEVVSDVRVRGRGVRGKKSYQRRLTKRAEERAERAAVEAQREAAEAAGPQVPQYPSPIANQRNWAVNP